MVKFSASKRNMNIFLVKELSNAIIESGIVAGSSPFFNHRFCKPRDIVRQNIFYYTIENGIIILLINIYIMICAVF